jgi:hypothetical protein
MTSTQNYVSLNREVLQVPRSSGECGYATARNERKIEEECSRRVDYKTIKLQQL